LNDVPKSIGIENPSTIYDYVWTTPSGEILVGPEIQIREGGNYSVEATTTDGTECSFQEEIFVNEFAIANLTTQDIEVIDNSDNNSIRINTNNLGIGQYEFALENENGVQTLFQDEPFFENLVGDIYTILVRDKNGCGTNSTLSVPVIQFPKFFTPNNDLQNDTWRIKGASSQFYPGSKISIYDRYGKLVASLDIDGPGWDGTYNSRILPSDDYWFSVLLIGSDEEPREFNGNFSLLRK
jgi:gliding motility-associated-like protein